MMVLHHSTERERALALTPVSRETECKLDILVAELARWQNAKNLVSATTLEHVWMRHIADSLQLIGHVPDGPIHWLDLGAGGGFPGLPIAALLAERSGSSMTLVESNGRKCAFLRHAARLMDVRVTVHAERIEAAIAKADLIKSIPQIGIVSARALAPLHQLLLWTEKLLTNGAVGLFPKGQDVESELTEASKYWRYKLEIHPSLTDTGGRIVQVSALSRR
jgi:16S rRNA (guanine527-N7)-methyltransferase